jgi:hypothetical protein
MTTNRKLWVTALFVSAIKQDKYGKHVIMWKILQGYAWVGENGNLFCEDCMRYNWFHSPRSKTNCRYTFRIKNV